MTKQPEALRLAELLLCRLNVDDPTDISDEAASLLRKQHYELKAAYARLRAMRRELARYAPDRLELIDAAERMNS